MSKRIVTFKKCRISTINSDEIQMKNLLIVLILSLGFSVLGVAQDAAKPAKKEHAKTKVAPAKAAEVKKAPEKKAEAAKPVVLKKDGTPDKRFKNNEAKPAGPLKKDCTI